MVLPLLPVIPITTPVNRLRCHAANACKANNTSSTTKNTAAGYNINQAASQRDTKKYRTPPEYACPMKSCPSRLPFNAKNKADEGAKPHNFRASNTMAVIS